MSAPGPHLAKGATTPRDGPRLMLRDEDGLAPEQLGLGAFARGADAVAVRLIAQDPDGRARLIEEVSVRLSGWRPRDVPGSVLAALGDRPERALRAAADPAAGTPVPPPGAPAPPPAARRLRAGALRALARKATWRFVEEQWTVGIAAVPVEAILRRGAVPWEQVRWLAPPRGGFIADPMVLPGANEAGASILAELFLFDERRGKIAVLDAAVDGGAPAATVLDLPWHLSYPFLLRHQGEIFCLPEMHEARRVQLFRAAPFPSRWEEGPVLLDGFAAVDATLHHDGLRFWLFCACQDDEPEGKLFLFHSETLTSGWTPHPANPVRHDLRNSRPAGPLFPADGALWRPTQDCTVSYGGAITVNRVLELTPERFVEEAAVRLVPDPEGPWPDGLHTLCAAGGRTLLDGKRHRVAPARGIKETVRALWRKAGAGGPAGQGGSLRENRTLSP